MVHIITLKLFFSGGERKKRLEVLSGETKVLRCDDLPITEDSGLTNAVFELPDISWPGIVFHQRYGARSEVFNARTIFVAGSFQNEPRQQHEVITTLPQWWKLNFNNVEAVIKVFSKASGFDGLFEVFMGRSKDTDVDVFGLGSAYWHHLSLLKCAQEFHLQVHGHLTNFIEEERSGISLLKSALAIMGCAGKRTLEMAKELALEELMRNCTAINGDKRAF